MSEFPISLEHKSIVDSTNALVAKRRSIQMLSSYYVLSADFQQTGKGRQGNSWVSEKGKNILASWYFTPSFLVPSNQFYLTVFVSLAIVDLLKMFAIQARIKWPNDIYVGDDKIAGILIENSIEGNSITSSIVGIGLNVNQIKFPAELKNVTSMRLLVDASYKVSELLYKLHQCLYSRYEALKSEKETLFSAYLDKLYRFKELSHFKDKNGLFEAAISTVEEDGVLVVHDDSGKQRKYLFGEIEFVFNA